MLDINELAEITQTILIDWKVIDTKTFTFDDPSIWWIWTYWIGTESIGVEWYGSDDDIFETYILRTKWNLNKKWMKIQWVWTMGKVAGKIRLKSVIPRVEYLPHRATALTDKFTL